MASDAIVAIQDMGAAGLTSSSVEMAGKGGVGIELDLDAVPAAKTGMTPYEMMLSESQERMLMVLKPGREADGRGDLRQVGARLRGHRPDHRHRPHGAECTRARSSATSRSAPLADDAPLYDRPWTCRRRKPRAAGRRARQPTDIAADLLKLMASPDMASRALDLGAVRPATSGPTPCSAPGGDAAIVRVHGTRQGAGDHHRLHAALLLRRPLSKAASRRSPRPGAT